MAEVVLLVGHDAAAQGAGGRSGLTEWLIGSAYVESYREALSAEGLESVAIWRSPRGGVWASRQRIAMDRARMHRPRAIIDLHANSSTDPERSGSLCVVPPGDPASGGLTR